MSAPEYKVIDLNTQPSYQSLLKGQPQTMGMRSGRVYLMPGDDCGLHSTKNHEETLVFLAGSGHAQIADKKVEVGVGKVSYIPPQTDHNITNTGTEPLVYVYVVAPIQS